MKFTKDMSIEEALRSHPRAIEVFNNFEMDCSDCLGAAAESIESAAMMHGIDPDDIVKELNALVNN
ncbi:MAG: DUF1858 domain-containing protein [Candidatus Tectomicrobia bacterium]|uniref:DUF1858 domain-containing protein n=1 Tax=Tectimicrobiota bacterium TaxID=2528274 RepID=A0A933GK82_UNCTE|nr:DUF1858 domain-containing protein [Candidatus Tectomicrobia bacterium]